MDVFASLSHQFIDTLQQGAQNVSRQARQHLTELQQRQPRQQLVLTRLSQLLDKTDQLLQPQRRTNSRLSQQERAAYEKETEKLLQRFLYEQYAQLNFDIPPVDVSYVQVEDELIMDPIQMVSEYIELLQPQGTVEMFRQLESLTRQTLINGAPIEPSEHKEVVLHRIDKDIVRTGRDSPFFTSTEKYTQMLRKLLFMFAVYHDDVGYVQGMADLLSPIIYMTSFANAQQLEKYEDQEVLVFWLFDALMTGPYDLEVQSRYQQDCMRKAGRSIALYTNYMPNQSGMNTRFHLVKHLFKWLDPVFHQHLTDMDTNDIASTSKPAIHKKVGIERVRITEVEGDWTELEPLDQHHESSVEVPIDDHPQMNQLYVTESAVQQGAMTFFWLFRSLLLLFKRDIMPLPVEVDGRDGHFDAVLTLWLSMLRFRKEKSAFPEVFATLALIGCYVRPLIIPTYPLDSPSDMRKNLALDEVDVTLDSIRERMWKEVIEGNFGFPLESLTEGMVSGEGALEIMLRCMSAVSGKISAGSLIRGMHYWHDRLLCLQSALIKEDVLKEPTQLYVITKTPSLKVPVDSEVMDVANDDPSSPKQENIDISMNFLQATDVALWKF